MMCYADELKVRQSVVHERRRVPAGTSEYQAAWIIEDSEGEGEESESEVSSSLDGLCTQVFFALYRKRKGRSLMKWAGPSSWWRMIHR
jgi:hypothetical protein